jgi:hypothetical protein
MFYIQGITSGVFKGYVHGVGGPNLYIIIYKPLCFKGKDAYIYKDMLKWNKSYLLHNLVAAFL